MRKDIESALSKAGVGIGLVALLGIAFFLFTLWRWGHFVKSTITYVVLHLASQSGISTNLLYGIVIIGTIPFFWAVAKYMHGAWFWLKGVGPGLRLYKSVHGMIIVAYVGLYFLAMYYVSRNSIAYKYCAQTWEGLKVFDDPVKDSVTGIQALPCSTQQIVDYERAKNPSQLIGPQRIRIADARTFPFFDNVTHNPRYWYSKSGSGEYEVFDQGGYNPGTNVALKPIDEAVREDMIRLQGEREDTQRQANQAAFVGKYLNPGSPHRLGSKQAAILVFSDDQKQLRSIEQLVGHAISDRGFTPVASFFKPAFVNEGRAGRLFAGDWDESTQLGLANRVGVIILGHATVSASESTQFDGLLSTRVSLELKCFNPSHQTSCGSRSFDSIGAGYSNEESLRNASDKARSEIDAFAETLTLD